jgi:hypothetical protein
MSDQYMRLLGVEEVERAARNFSGAADQITRAVEYFEHSVTRLERVLDEHARRVEAAMQAPSETIAEAVEWETEDGTQRTTDKKLAKNWAVHVGVRVVRRAGRPT